MLGCRAVVFSFQQPVPWVAGSRWERFGACPDEPTDRRVPPVDQALLSAAGRGAAGGRVEISPSAQSAAGSADIALAHIHHQGPAVGEDERAVRPAVVADLAEVGLRRKDVEDIAPGDHRDEPHPLVLLGHIDSLHRVEELTP